MDGYAEHYSLERHFSLVAAEDSPCTKAGRAALETAERIAALLDRYPQDWGVSPAVIDQWAAQLDDIEAELLGALGEPRVLYNGWLVLVETRDRLRARESAR